MKDLYMLKRNFEDLPPLTDMAVLSRLNMTEKFWMLSDTLLSIRKASKNKVINGEVVLLDQEK